MAIGYDVQYKESVSMSWIELAVTDDSAVVSLPCGKLYEFRVRSQCDGGGVTNYSPIDEIMPSCALATSSPSAGLTRLELSPNPFHDKLQLQVELDRPMPLSIRLYDARGSLLLPIDRDFQTGSHQIELLDAAAAAKLSAGVYFVKLSSPLGFASQKLVKF